MSPPKHRIKLNYRGAGEWVRGHRRRGGEGRTPGEASVPVAVPCAAVRPAAGDAALVQPAHCGLTRTRASLLAPAAVPGRGMCGLLLVSLMLTAIQPTCPYLTDRSSRCH